MMNKQQANSQRYQRQVLLKDFGDAGQQKLLQAHVVVIGAGGLGCPALQYLAAAGIGCIGIVDDDVVALHNLHRQVLFTTGDVGRKKAEVAAARLQQMNPEIAIKTYPVRLTNQNALDLLSAYDIVLDATDNFTTRYLVNDACVLLHKPLVYGAISQFEGQVAVFNAGANSVNYRDLFPEPPQPGSVLNCAEAGVLGVLPGLIGTVQATEVIKLLSGLGKPLVNQLFTYNALTNDSFVFDLSPKEGTASLLPQTAVEFAQRDYEEWCEGKFQPVEEIDVTAFEGFLLQKETLIIDVREAGEQPEVNEFVHQRLPLSILKESIPDLAEETVILFCQSGKRSREAATILSATFGRSKKIYSLKGGILQWKNEQHGQKA
jgi:adenylyltransferase/sulfurtransferase